MYIELCDSFFAAAAATNYGVKTEKFFNNFSNEVVGHSDGIPFHLCMEIHSCGFNGFNDFAVIIW